MSVVCMIWERNEDCSRERNQKLKEQRKTAHQCHISKPNQYTVSFSLLYKIYICLKVTNDLSPCNVLYQFNPICFTALLRMRKGAMNEECFGLSGIYYIMKLDAHTAIYLWIRSFVYITLNNSISPNLLHLLSIIMCHFQLTNSMMGMTPAYWRRHDKMESARFLHTLISK